MRDWRGLVAALMLLGACASEPGAGPALACPADGKALFDLGVMRDVVAGHMVYPTGGSISAQSIYDSLAPSAQKARTRDEELRVLEDFVYALGDHHAHLGTNADSSRRLVPTAATVWAESRGGEIVLTQVRPGSAARSAGLREGMVVESIDGASPMGLVAPPSDAGHAEAMRGFAVRVAMAGTHEHDATVAARGPGGRVTATLSEIVHADGPPATLTFPMTGVAMIRLNNSIGNSALTPEFDRMMKQAKAARAVILDLRDTPSGGNSDVAKPLMSWFVQGTRGYQKHESKERSWVEQVSGRGDGFRGKLIVLADHWTGSMGEGTAIGLRSAASATLVGTPMAGLRGAIEGFDLPCLGAPIRVPIERLYTVDGQPRELAQPDVLVSEADLANAGLGDAILERALELLR